MRGRGFAGYGSAVGNPRTLGPAPGSQTRTSRSKTAAKQFDLTKEQRRLLARIVERDSREGGLNLAYQDILDIAEEVAMAALVTEKCMLTPDFAREINESIEPFSELECVGGELYLGSMFYIDFGGTFDSTASNGRPIKVGEMTLGVRDVNWSLFEGADVRVTAASARVEVFDCAISMLKGQTVSCVAYGKNRSTLEVRFSAGWCLSIDLENESNIDGDLFELSLPDGRVMTVESDGKVVSGVNFDEERARHWKRSARRN